MSDSPVGTPAGAAGPSRSVAIVMIAVGVVVALIIGIGVVWFVTDRASAASVGTLDSLADAGSAGAWQPVAQTPVGRAGQKLTAGTAETLTVDRAAADLPGNTVSVLLQLEIAAAAQSGGLSVGGPAEAAPTVSTIGFTAGTAVTTSQLVLLDEKGTFTVTADTDVAVTLTLFAYLDPTEDDAVPLGPGGTAAIPPRPIIDAQTGLGGGLTSIGSPTSLSPRGLGDVPTTGVQAVWLQLSLLGAPATESTLRIGGTESPTTVLSSFGSWANALILVPLDERGLFSWQLEGAVEQARASVTGWVAGQDMALNAATIAGGVVPLAVTDITESVGTSDSELRPTLPDTATGPHVGSALYSVQLTGPAVGDVSADRGDSLATERRETTLPVSGLSSSLVVAGPDGTISLPDDAAAGTLTLLGYFPTELPTDAVQPSISIDTPRANATVNLADAGGTFGLSGTISSTGAGVRLVEAKLGSRSIGAAQIDATTSPVRWSIDTSAPPGTHEVTVVLTDWSGAHSEAVVSFAVEAPVETVAVATDSTVVLEDAELATVSALTSGSITFAGPAPAVVGEFIVAGVSDATPNGLLRKVTGIELTAGGLVMTTTDAALSDILLQVDYGFQDQSLSTETITEPDNDPAQAAPVARNTGLTVAPASFVSTGSDTAVTAVPAATSTLPPVDLKATVTVTAADEPDVKLKLESTVGKVSTELTLEPLGGAAAAASCPGAPTSASATATPSPFDAVCDDPTATDAENAKKRNQKLSTSVKTSAEIGAEFSLKYSYVTTATLKIKIRANWEWGVPRPELELFETSATQVETKTTEVNAYGKVGVTFAATGKKRPKSSSSLPTFDLNKLPPVTLGRVAGVIPAPIPIPITILFQLRAEFTASVVFSGAFTEKTKEVTTRTIGIRWTNGTVKDLGSTKNTKQPATWKVAAEIAFTVTPAIYIDVLVYDSIGVFFGVTAVNKFTVNTAAAGTDNTVKKASYTSKYNIKVSFVVGVKFALFSNVLLEKKYERVISEADIWEVEYSTDDAILASQANADDADSDGKSASGTGNRALLVVVDLSGSMAGERIEKARGAMTDLVMDQPVGAELGIWTYGGDCTDPGDYAMEVRPVQGTGEVVDIIDGFTAAGGTPTAEALIGATDRLTADGSTGATVILVSDGESNCGDPCAAASKIRAQGFDLQVHSIGMEMASGGAAELTCVADTTGGSYTSVDDVDELAATLAELGRASVDLSVAIGDTALANQAQTVDIVVSNPTARDAADISVAVTFPGGDLVPVVSPAPQLVIGNVPPGGRVVRTVQLYPVTQDAVGSTDYRVLAWGPEVDAVVIEGSYTTVSTRTDAIVPGAILADPITEKFPVALVGDETIAGAADSADPEGCGATEGPYADALGGAAVAVVLACPGASANTLAAAGRPAGSGETSTQLLQLAEQDTVGAVILSAGAEDIGLPALLAGCMADGCALDSPAVRTAIGKAQELDLSGLYRQAWATANTTDAIDARGGAFAPVVVLAYPQVFPVDRGLTCTADGDTERARAGGTLIAYLNASLESAVTAVAAEGYEVYFSSAPALALLPNHTVCDDDSYIEVAGDGRLIPTSEGFQALADGLLLWSQGRERVEPEESVVADADALAVQAPTVPGLVGQAISDLANPRARVELVEAGEGPAVITVNRPVDLLATGFEPGSPVVATLYGQPTILGTVLADADGQVRLTAMVPVGTELGTATLTAAGVGADGLERVLVHDVRVSAEVPLWLVLLLLSGLVLAVGAVALGLLGWRVARGRPAPRNAKPIRSRVH